MPPHSNHGINFFYSIGIFLLNVIVSCFRAFHFTYIALTKGAFSYIRANFIYHAEVKI